MSAVLSEAGRNDLRPDAWCCSTKGLTVAQDSQNTQREGKSHLPIRSLFKLLLTIRVHGQTPRHATQAQSPQPCLAVSPLGIQGPLFRPHTGNLIHLEPEVREGFLTLGSWRQLSGEVTPKYLHAHLKMVKQRYLMRERKLLQRQRQLNDGKRSCCKGNKVEFNSQF